jgi:hypothetical protein
MDEVALAEGAPGEELDGVHAAHVGLDDGHHLLVGGMRADLLQRDLGGPDPHGEAGTHVAVKRHGLLQRLCVGHRSTLCCITGGRRL